MTASPVYWQHSERMQRKILSLSLSWIKVREENKIIKHFPIIFTGKKSYTNGDVANLFQSCLSYRSIYSAIFKMT